MRYVDADNLPRHGNRGGVVYWRDIEAQPTADVRENVKAQKVVGGGERDGSTCWFECSQCHGTVDIDDAYCKHCGAQMER